MKRLLYIPLLFLALVSLGNNYIDSAETFYANGNYQKALEAYQKIQNNGSESAQLYYNIANCYYRLKDLPSAILYYERAKLLAPNDEDIIFNLELAQSMIIDNIESVPEIFFVRWFKNTTQLFASDEWALLSLGSFVLFLLALCVFLFFRVLWIKKIGFTFSIVFLIACAVTLSFSSSLKKQYERREYAIVFTPTVVVKSSPDKSGTDIFIIHEGLKIKVIQALGEWIEIRIADGNKGWIKASDIILI